MPATLIPASTRFYAPEVTVCYFIPTIASTSLVPTRPEIDAGHSLANEIADVSGWTVQSETIDTPDMGSRFTRQIGGRTTAPSSSITFYADQESTDVRTILPRGTTGFIMWCDGGDVPTQKADVFPVEVLSLGKTRTVATQAGQIQVDFSITGVPAEDVAIPAAT
jgi:hypothetical protein